ncbi:ECF-type sigma factor [Singulisphaera acidiphila]|uniref:DNA-directed RNA polymerase specialized sigma subunit, sigma24 n=1 Tax=Singulisphaera acidiphila (strain ATCC BAA-1392 / DSM 18658 / VKM B-2454 / MOB10) TaxID=886293 RepID=L0DL45_SINAD|nr:ECF-type sigma factor [Singulisphaera acidiphila]AGA29366.1 DNA-directed RNA polymerase specialized sigma subunit, sigma24 [Singulisphaera acidiphila DSM 18658]
MTEASTFDQLIRRVRAWDHDAAAELVRLYEPAIRRAIRFRLADAHLRGLLDSMDICQSVLKSFFVRAASGQYDLSTPEQLLGLLSAMARKKLISETRRLRSQRRGGLHVTSGGHDQQVFVDPGASPIAEASARDLLQQVRHRLSPDERLLLDFRNQGHDWATIASQLPGDAGALRKKLTRALDRVAGELGLDDEP